MGSFITKRLFFAGALSFGLVGACGSDGGKGKPSGDGPKTLVCTSDAECSSEKPFCDPYSGCAECLLNAQCGEGLRCVAHECTVPTTCAESADCDAANPVCNTILGECVGCVSDSDCAAEAVCLEGSCTDVTRCVNTHDCSDSEVCARDLGYCVQCVGDGDCDEGSACVENSCVLGCDSDNDCRSGGLLCDAEAGHCVECVEQADCPDVYNCRSGRCVVDECLQGTASCLENGHAISRCNEFGSDSSVSECPADSTCQGSTGEAACYSWVCTPGSTSCGTMETLRICDETGLGYTEAIDCAADDGKCVAGACVDIVCNAGEQFCDGSVFYECDFSGTSLAVHEVCDSTEYCSALGGGCSAQVCTPGSTACSGSVVQKCNSEGSALEVLTDCNDDDAVCVDGACVPTICTPNEKRCNEDETAVYVCDEAGTSFVLSTACSSNNYCDEETALCRLRTCTAGAAVCDGEVATTCNESGSGPAPGGTDCSTEDNQACWNGECRPRICTGSFYCSEGESHDCLNNGTAHAVDVACSATQFCNEATGRCQSQTCAPESAGCVDNTPGVCNAEGSAYEATGDPCDDGEACVSGVCLPMICTPNSYYCEGQAIYDCGSDGTTSTLVTTCSESRFCEEGVSSCRTDVCTAGEPTCDGELVATCNSVGSGTEDDATACPSGQTCNDGACVDVVCDAGQRFCDGDTLSLCNETGTGVASTETCSEAQFCDESGDQADCSPDICAAGEPACDGERLATCADDGGSYSDHSTNCANSDKVCNLTACANSATDTVGEVGYFDERSNYRIANRYYITTTRTLTEIEQYMYVSGTSQFTWFVYEGTTESSFTKIFESLNTSSGAETFHSSGAISVPLVEGRYYMIGVRVADEAVGYLTPVTGGFVSFGVGNGSDLASTTGSLPSSWTVSPYVYGDTWYAYYQRLTTTLP